MTTWSSKTFSARYRTRTGVATASAKSDIADGYVVGGMKRRNDQASVFLGRCFDM